MDKKKNKSTTTTTASGGGASHRLPGVRRIQNFLVVWLDDSIDEMHDKDYINIISKLREVANSVNTFTDINECIDFIRSIKQEKIFLISSDALGQTTVPIIHPMLQVNAIYIFCGDKVPHEQWVRDWLKIKGVFTDITPICEALKTAVQQCDQNLLSIGFVAPTDGAINPSLDQLDQSFMYTQILKEILLTIDFEQQHIDKFIQYCQQQYVGNNMELKNIDKLKREYREYVPIWWYTYPSFLYSMLNRALRLMEVDLIISLGFFIRDLLEDISLVYTQQYGEHHHPTPFIVYRGQGLSQTDFDQLMKTKGGLISFNNFLSTSLKREVSFLFAESNSYSPDLIGVLFRITVDPSINSAPFATISDLSYFETEDEILFSMHSIFRVREVKPLGENNCLWEVELILTTDNDPQLRALTECIREETFPDYKGWYRLGHILYKLGQFEQAQQVFEILLDENVDDGERANIHHMLGLVKEPQGKYDDAIAAHQKAIEFYQTHSSHSRNLAGSYCCIGVVYQRMGEYSKALTSYEEALQIQQKVFPPKHLHLAASYSNIGTVHATMGDYFKALSSFEKALEIFEQALPPNHPRLASFYNNIGAVYEKIDEYSKALSLHENALKIYQNVLPPNHPDLATSYNNIGWVYEEMGQHSKALSSFEKALEILQKVFLPNHPHLGASYVSHGVVYYRMGNYSKALSFFERALDIKQHVLPANDPDLRRTKQWIEDTKKKL